MFGVAVLLHQSINWESYFALKIYATLNPKKALYSVWHDGLLFKVPLAPNFFLAVKKVLFVLITLVKKLWSYGFSSIFCEFSNFEKYAPLWSTAEL